MKEESRPRWKTGGMSVTGVSEGSVKFTDTITEKIEVQTKVHEERKWIRTVSTGRIG